MEAAIHSDSDGQHLHQGAEPPSSGSTAQWDSVPPQAPRARGLGVLLGAVGVVRDSFCVTVDALYGRYDR